MSSNLPARWLVTLSALLALNLAAQTAPSPPPSNVAPRTAASAPTRAAAVAPASASANPADAPAAAQAASGTYRSAFDGYQAFGEERVLPWKDVNDIAGKIGGWRAYAKEAADSPASEGRASAPTPLPSATDPHAGHAKP